ncbi:transposase [Saccharothrix sp. ALI-22-I]|uniref:transposase n=1 Tax=Saccharothrix sp. ALI-22-I TaxID=1933778 RepID=UPI001EE70DFB|nr:transposase [Saccharothrix sp. ALI-22-I]
MQLPFLSRPVRLPVLARSWQPRRTGKLAYAREMAELIATRHPDRTVHVVGDAAYVGEHLRGLATQITWTSRLKVSSVLYALAPPHNGKLGRPRTKGVRLGTQPISRPPRRGAPRESAATDAPIPCASPR